MRDVGVFEAKNKLGQLLDLVERGEEVTITRHGKEVARQSLTVTRRARRYGALANARSRANSGISTGPSGSRSEMRDVRDTASR